MPHVRAKVQRETLPESVAGKDAPHATGDQTAALIIDRFGNPLKTPAGHRPAGVDRLCGLPDPCQDAKAVSTGV